MLLNYREVLEALHLNQLNHYSEETVFTGISTDTRTLQPGDLFVALVNSRADGHDYLSAAVEAGAAGLLISEEETKFPEIPKFRVHDTEIAYGQLARYWRDQFNIPVIAITGSVGKTTVKEMIANVLSPLGPILKTEASQNNETGVPKTILQMSKNHCAAVIEMGMRGRGQIAALCQIARPTVGVITVISDNHRELLGSRDEIANAKGELLESLPQNGFAILNADDSYFDFLKKKTHAKVREFKLSSQVGEKPLNINSPSQHDQSNARAALAVADILGVSRKSAIQALEKYTPPPMRMEILKLKNEIVILNDSYNAAPASMESALKTLRSYDGGRKIAFLGDMKELGDITEEAHQFLGDVVQKLGGIDALYAVGGFAAQIPGAIEYFPSSTEAVDFVSKRLELSARDIVLVKGSRAMAMERVVEALSERYS